MKTGARKERKITQKKDKQQRAAARTQNNNTNTDRHKSTE